MKRIVTWLLIASLLLFSGCGNTKENTCTFYYLRTSDTIVYGQPDALAAPVSVEIATQDAQLSYLLQLYLEGPTEANYVNPIPSGTFLLSTLWEDNTLVLVMSREFSQLEGIRLTLAGTCLAATCHALAGAETIQIRSAEETYEFTIDDCIFLDDSTGK